MTHDHDDQNKHGSKPSEMELRVRALETVLAQKGYVDPAALDVIIETFESKIGPHIGAASSPRRGPIRPSRAR
jgi:nitrile hydratase subunit alpha